MYKATLLEQQRTSQPTPTPTPRPGNAPWSRTELITAGFSTPAEWGVPSPRRITGLCWHDMEGWFAAAISHWNTGVAGAHLCVLQSGEIVRSCLIENIAWHAGTDWDIGRTLFWKTHNINPTSIGVELEGFYTQGYTEAQIQGCIRIAQWAKNTYGIPPEHKMDALDGHHMHSEISNQRADPGSLFPLGRILSAVR